MRLTFQQSTSVSPTRVRTAPRALIYITTTRAIALLDMKEGIAKKVGRNL